MGIILIYNIFKVLILPILGVIIPAMGRISQISISDALFSSVQQRVLALLFGNPDRSFYTSEIIRNVRSGTGAVERELSRLLHSGLVLLEQVGNQKHYRANPKSPVFEELRGIVLKTFGLTEPLRAALAPYSDKIEAAFVYGSVAKNTDTARSDIDVMVIGDGMSYTDLYAAFQGAEAVLGRQVNPTFLTREDWKRKLLQRDSLIDKISAQPKIFLFGLEERLHG